MKISFKYTHVKREESKHIDINKSAPRGQRSPTSFRVTMMGSWFYVPRLVMICQRAAEIWAYFLFGDLAVKFDWL